MSMVRKLGLAALVLACCPWSTSQAGVYVGHCGGWGCGWGYRPCYRPYYWGPGPFVGFGAGLVTGAVIGAAATYPAYPVYAAPPAVIVQQPPAVIVQQSPVVTQPAYPPSTSNAPPAPLPPPRPLTPAVAMAPANPQPDVDAYIQLLGSQQEETRIDALIQLGRIRANRATGPMIKALNSDPSPKVRETAARSLGMIADPGTLAALQRAAQADEDRDVRHSASFSAEIIRGNLQQRNP